MYRAAENHLKKSDPKLGRVIGKFGPCTMVPSFKMPVHQSLIQSVIYQQLNGRAAKTILGRFVDLFPGKGFPKPEAILSESPSRIRSAGISRAKLAAILDIAEKAALKEIPSKQRIVKLTDEEIIENLTSLRGVGVWTVQMLLIFRLGRLDVLPSADFGVRKGFSIVYGKKDLPDPKTLHAHGERWRPYRSIASWYLWRATDN